MLIYHYNRDTGELIGQDIAQPDPMDDGRFIVPAFSTSKVPPVPPPGMVPVYDTRAKQWATRQARSAAPASTTMPTLSLDALLSMLFDAKAIDAGFINMADAMTYVDESEVPRYQALALALRSWRSSVRLAAEAIDRDGDTVPKTMADLERLVPAFVPPKA